MGATEQRKLAAIMFTDMVGYSALTQRDEALALDLLQEHHDLLRDILPMFQGNEIKSTGDGLLVEFSSALAAVQCAVEIQRTLAERNEKKTEERQIKIRIGIHLGDVVMRGDDVLGDGVNIAARIEPLAAPGGVCITRAVFEQIENKVAQPCVQLSKPELKNISANVEVYKLVLNASPADLKTAESSRKQLYWVVLGVVVLNVVLFLKFGVGNKTKTAPSPKTNSIAVVAAPNADQQSIAVLAFANLSEEKDNEFFSDGISEELLNVLAKVPGLKVTARTSSFFFKGKQVPLVEIAKQLGVAYVVEGSVRKSGNRVRITAQLIKAADGFHVWSDTFTRDLKDVFAVQDEIAGLVAQYLSLKLGTAGPSAAIDPEAFRLYLEGRQEWSLRTEASLAKAEKFFTQAIGLDPKFARAHAGLADVWMIRADQLERANKDAAKAYVLASESLDRALQLDPELAEAYATRGNYFVHKEQFAEAEQAFKRAIALNPNYASAHQWYGRLLFTLGKLDAGLAELELATRLDPLSPIITSNYGMFLGFARRWSESLAVCDRVLAIRPDFEQALGSRAWALVHLDRRPEALALLRANFKSLGSNAPPDPDGDASALRKLALAGDRANAERLAAPILAGKGRNSAKDIFSLLLALNQNGEAFNYLENSQSRFTRTDLGYFLDPVYDPVRADLRFLRKLDEAGLLATYNDIWAQYLAWKKKSGQP